MGACAGKSKKVEIMPSGRPVDQDFVAAMRKIMFEEKARKAPVLKIHLNSKYVKLVNRRDSDKSSGGEDPLTCSSIIAH